MTKTLDRTAALLGCLLLACSTVGHGAAQTRSLPREGPYLGETPPGMTPKVFGEGVVSTDRSELNAAFAPDGRELYFTVRTEGRNTLMGMTQRAGRWDEPATLPFSGTYSDVDPYVTADGRRLYFSSTRPLDGVGPSKDSDLWYVERTATGEWGSPVRMDAPNTPGKDDYYTSMTGEGALYFSVFETHSSPGDIYASSLVEGRYAPPERIEGPVNTGANEHDPFVAPDGSFLLFSSNRPGGFGSGDLYVAFRGSGGAWTDVRNLGAAVNSGGYEFCPMISPDGRYLFFTRTVDGNGDIYWVDAKIVDTLRPSPPAPARRP